MKLDRVVFLILLCYLLLLIATYVLKVKLLVVTSNSMKPSFEFGDVLLAVSQEHYQPDDTISFTTNGSIVTHRIMSVKKTRSVSAEQGAEQQLTTEYQTRGDANTSADLSLVSHSRVLGKVAIVIPKIGYLVLFLQSKFVAISVIFLSILIFISQLFFRKFQNYA